MAPPTTDILARLPLADAVLTLWRWAADPETLDRVFEQYRGRCYEKEISFPSLVGLIRDALVEHDGSGRASFDRARHDGELDASSRAAYAKLGRLPIPVSQALLARCTERLRQVYPDDERARTALPGSLDPYDVLVLDGKAIKRVAKLLKPTRDAAGGLLGGRALVALQLRTGLAVAMHAHPDGDANEVAFVGPFVPALRRIVPGPRLWVADASFCDLTQPARFARDGDAYLIRYHPKVPFHADPARQAVEGRDARGRRYRQDWGWLGSPRHKVRPYVRRIVLYRPGERDVVLVTDLCDAEAVPAADLLEAYLNRWGIERMFQRVTEVFHLGHLIGTRPPGTIFQFALCLLLSNLIEVVRGLVAAGSGRRREEVSGEKLFEDVGRQMIAWSEVVSLEATLAHLSGEWTSCRVRARLSELLSGLWRDRWAKSAPKKASSAGVRVRKRTHGSVQRILEEHQRRVREAKRAHAGSPLHSGP